MSNHQLSKYYLPSLFFVIILSACGCSKLIGIDAPKTQLSSDNVYADNSTAAAVLTGLYAQLSSEGLFTGRGSISVKAALSADELTLSGNAFDPSLKELYVNGLSSHTTLNPWRDLYKYINVANTAIEGLDKSQTLLPGVKQQLLGEAKFMRAFLHFYLVNLYDSIPLVTTSDYRVNNTIARSTPDLVYNQIIDDLTDAADNLSENYLSADVQNVSTERVRPTKWSAEMLLARAYLFKKDYANAIIHASTVIARSDLFDTTKLSDIFLATSKEAIWQLAPISTYMNTYDGTFFILTRKPAYGNPVYCSPSLMNAFEPDDRRRREWIDSIIVNGVTYHFPFKYKIASGGPPVEYTTVLRLGELYLIRAEANANTGMLAAANDDLNVLRTRAGLPLASWSNKDDLMTAIAHERQIELFTEWGNRWIDLKRYGTVDDIMSVICPQKGGVWKTTASLYPIPFDDILSDRNLTQNSGY